MILGIETATLICGVALADDSGLVADYRLHRGLSHAEILPTVVERVMAEAGIDKDVISGIAVSCGPGSFTGLRIGIGFAKGLTLGWSKPMLTVPTMDGMVAVLPGVAEWACVLLKARKGEAYRGLYRWSGSNWITEEEIRTVMDSEISDGLRDGPVVFLGEGAEMYRAGILETIQNARFVTSSLTHPSGYGVALAGLHLLKEGKTVDPDSAVPMYIKRFQGVV